MPSLLSARSRGGEAAAGGTGGIGNRACYGIAACAAALLLFCALAVSVKVWMAFTFGGLALVTFAVAGCLAPRRPSGGAAAAEREAADAARARRRFFGLPKAAIHALPTFVFELAAGAAGDLEAGTRAAAAAGGEGETTTCSVCLEDVQAGETVRQLPACGHLFHVECIDMWLHSHRTCPVCRCNLLPPPTKAAAKAAAPTPVPAPTAEAAEPSPAAAADEALPLPPV